MRAAKLPEVERAIDELKMRRVKSTSAVFVVALELGGLVVSALAVKQREVQAVIGGGFVGDAAERAPAHAVDAVFALEHVGGMKASARVGREVAKVFVDQLVASAVVESRHYAQLLFGPQLEAVAGYDAEAMVGGRESPMRRHARVDETTILYQLRVAGQALAIHRRVGVEPLVRNAG